MPSINLDLNYFDHPKTKRLVGLLGRGADVLPVRLWCTCGKHYSDSGELTGLTAQEIESQVAWWGRPGQMVAAMLKVGFLEEIDGQFVVHDWTDHASHISAYREKARKMVQARRDKKAALAQKPTSSQLPSQLDVEHDVNLMSNQCNAMQYKNYSSRDPTTPEQVPRAPPPRGSRVLTHFEAEPLAKLFAKHYGDVVTKAHSLAPGVVVALLTSETVDVEALKAAATNYGQNRDLFGVAPIHRMGLANWITQREWERFLPGVYVPPTPQEIEKGKSGGNRRGEKPVLTSRVPINFDAPPRGTTLEVPADWRPGQGLDSLFPTADETA